MYVYIYVCVCVCVCVTIFTESIYIALILGKSLFIWLPIKSDEMWSHFIEGAMYELQLMHGNHKNKNILGPIYILLLGYLRCQVINSVLLSRYYLGKAPWDQAIKLQSPTPCEYKLDLLRGKKNVLDRNTLVLSKVHK